MDIPIGYLWGMQTLAQYLEAEKLTQAAFASRVGRTQATISRILNGEAQPSAELAASIEQATGGRVPFWAWKAFERFRTPTPQEAEARAAERGAA